MHDKQDENPGNTVGWKAIRFHQTSKKKPGFFFTGFTPIHCIGIFCCSPEYEFKAGYSAVICRC
jgi:hypothetical protein